MPQTASTASALTLYNRPVSDWIYAYALASAWKSPWVYDPSGALLSEPDVWELVRNESGMLGEILRRNANVTRPWRVVPNYHASIQRGDRQTLDASKRLAAICHEGLAHNIGFDEQRTVQSEAFFLGRRYGLVKWERVHCSLDGTPETDWYLPYAIQDIDRRRIHIVADWAWVRPDGTQELVPAGSEYTMPDGRKVSMMPHPEGGYFRKVGTHLELFNTDTYRWERISAEKRRNLVESVWYDTEDRVAHGRGVLEAGFFTHWWLIQCKTKTFQGIDRYANGVLVGRLDSLRNASTDTTNEDMVSAMESVMNTYRSEHYIVLGDGDDIEIKEPKGTGIQIAMQFAEYLIQEWARLCNGSVRPSGHGITASSGGRAQAKEEGDTSEAYYQPSRSALDHDYDRDLLGTFLYHNESALARFGLAKAKRPKLTSEQIKRQSPTDSVAVMSQVLAAGQPILKAEFYENVELTPPGPDDDVVKPQQTMASQQLVMGDALERDRMKQDGERADKDRTAKAAAEKPAPKKP